MRAYYGPVIVRLDDGFRALATANLSPAPGMGGWSGEIAADPDVLWRVFFAQGAATLRLPYAREAIVVPDRYRVGERRMPVRGHGPAPF